MISPDGPVYQAGTLSGNPVATTAGIETLNILKNDPQIYERLEQKQENLLMQQEKQEKDIFVLIRLDL